MGGKRVKELLMKGEKKIQFIYEVAYIMLIISTFNSFIFTSGIQSILVKVCLFTAACAVIVRLCFLKKYLHTPYWKVLLLFLISYLVSTFYNYQYGYVDNLKWLIWIGLSFFLLYLRDYECDFSYYKKEFMILGHILLVYSVVASIISLLMMVNRYAEYLIGANDTTVMAGYFWGRLWGVYTDPNYGATFCVSMIILAIYFAHETSNKLLKILYGFMSIINFFYVVYSDSRTAKVAIFLAGGFFLFSHIWYMFKNKKQKKYIGISLLCTILFVGAINTLMSGCKSLYVDRIAVALEEKEKKEEQINENQEAIASEKNDSKEQKQENTEQKNNKANDVTSAVAAKEREKDVKKDISNRRFDLWKSGIEVWATTPLFGTGYATYDDYALENVPNTYTVNNDQGIFGNTHNQYINILVFQGIIGAGVFLIFMLLVICKILPFVWKSTESDFFYLVTMLSIVGVVAISMMFLLEGLYTNSFGTFLLWYSLGNIMHFIDRKQNK